MEIPFGEWLPDQPARHNPGAILAKNCIPADSFYRQFNSLAPFSDALDGMAKGNFWARSAAGVVSNFAGDASKLYSYDGAGGWNDVSGSAYSASNWDFTSFQDRVIATDGGGSDLQFFDLATSSAFDDLPGGPPRAKVLTVIRDFVFLGNYAIGGEVESGGYAWSGFNNSELWEPSLSTQAGRRRTRGGGGQVQRIIGGTQGLIFHESALRLITYVGPPTIWKLDDVTTLHGTTAPRSVCWTEDKAFYYSQEGFRQINRNTLELTPIGKFKVDEWFRANAASSDIVNMQGTVDRRNSVVYWAFRSSSSSPSFDRILVFNYAAKPSGRWAYAELQTEYVGEFSSVGFNLDTIGALLGGNIDTASINVDTDAYSGGEVTLMAFNPGHMAATFAGTPLTAELDTREQEADEGKRGYTNGVRPLVEATSAPTIQVRPILRDLLTVNPNVGSAITVNAIGQADLRADARYHRYRVRIAGGFDKAVGVQVPLKPRGSR